MRRDEYDQQMQRLEEVYGDRAYPKERRELIWKEMQNLAPLEFQDIVSELIGSASSTPLLGKFREAKIDLSRKNAGQYQEAEQMWMNSQPWCHLCGKNGHIIAVHVATGYSYAFACGCEIGQRKCPKYPRWDARYSQEYTPKFAGAATPEPTRPTTRPDFRALAAGATKDMPQDSDLT